MRGLVAGLDKANVSVYPASGIVSIRSGSGSHPAVFAEKLGGVGDCETRELKREGSLQFATVTGDPEWPCSELFPVFG